MSPAEPRDPPAALRPEENYAEHVLASDSPVTTRATSAPIAVPLVLRRIFMANLVAQVGIVVTGAVLAFVAKFWNDVFDILYEFKRWLRGHANAMKPEPSTRSRTVTRRTRPSRRRAGGEGNGDQRPRDPRDNRNPRDSRPPRE